MLCKVSMLAARGPQARQGSTPKQKCEPELLRVATATNLEGRQALALTQSASTWVVVSVLGGGDLNASFLEEAWPWKLCTFRMSCAEVPDLKSEVLRKEKESMEVMARMAKAQSVVREPSANEKPPARKTFRRPS